MEFQDLLEKTTEYLPEEKISVVKRAFNFASEKHEGQKRLSGEPYIFHPLSIAIYLANLRQDAATVAAALLHDVVEDCGVTLEELEIEFDGEISKLVDGVTKLGQLNLMSENITESTPSHQERIRRAQSIRKMLVAMAEDIRVILIKLGDRLHNMQTLGAQSPERRALIAQETLDVYAPLAHRLGIWEIKWQLEDLAFQYLNEQAFQEINRLLLSGQKTRQTFIDNRIDSLILSLSKVGIKAEVFGRPKNIFSIHQKIQKYRDEGKDFDKIFDLYAVRVLVSTKSDCYNALGVVHNFWHPIHGSFDDYIANPKQNLYQSLHTTVMCDGISPLEIQIRTHEMHRIAEYGIAAHRSYKEGKSLDEGFEQKMGWLRQLLEWQREVPGTEEFLESVKTDILQDQVFVYTPRGDIKELPSGSTPIDLAFRVHSNLGFRCIGAKINGRLVPLNTSLENGDTVEIVTSKTFRAPSLDWLNPALGYVHTASAKQKIRQWFRRRQRSETTAHGKELLSKVLRRIASKIPENELIRILKFDTLDDLWVALGSGNLSISQIETKLLPHDDPLTQTAPKLLPTSGSLTGIKVLGVGDLLTKKGLCCNPLPGDAISGYITRSRGVTIHRKNCSNLTNEREPQRIVDVSWGPSHQLHSARVAIMAVNRVGLLRDVSTLVSGENVNIASISADENPNGTAILNLTLYVKGVEQLSRVFSKIEGISGILNIMHINWDNGNSNHPI